MWKSIINTTTVHKYSNFHFLKKKSPCFEGFYFKTAQKSGSTLVIICGFAKSNDKQHAFIQVSTQSIDTFYFEYPLNDLKSNDEAFSFTLGKNKFNQEGIRIDEKDCQVELKFSDFTLWNRSYFNPSIMGVLTYVPFVECKHDIISPSISVSGSARLNERELEFDSASGYIDKNWGKSFPKDYFWGHISSFNNSSISIQFAKARPKWLFWKIPVHVGFLRINDEIHLFRSWKKGKMTFSNVGQEKLVLVNKRFKIVLHFDQGRALNLKAPYEGKLDQLILERAGISTRVRIYEVGSTKESKVVVDEMVFNSTLEVSKEK